MSSGALMCTACSTHTAFSLEHANISQKMSSAQRKVHGCETLFEQDIDGVLCASGNNATQLMYD